MTIDKAISLAPGRAVPPERGVRRWPVPAWLVLPLAVALGLFAFGIAAWLRGRDLGVDSSVYRAGAVLALHGHSLYDAGNLGYLHQDSFTYPPAAALLFAPLAALPMQLAWAVMASATVLALALTIQVVTGTAPPWRHRAAWRTPLLTAAMLCLMPVWRTIGLGQVNVLLMAMVIVDVLVVTARRPQWGGVLVGVAAAVKLVPLVFIPYLLLTGRRAAAARALAVFAGLQALMLVIAPRDDAYWTSYLFKTGRIGPAQDPANQSLTGLLARAFPGSAEVALAIGVLLAIPALMLMLRFHRRGFEVPALCVAACYGLLLAPVSWVPCWVWIVVALLSWPRDGRPGTGWAGTGRAGTRWHGTGWADTGWRDMGWRGAGRRRWAGRGVVMCVVALFACPFPIWAGPQDRRALGPFWWFVLSNLYVLTALAAALVLCIVWLLRPDRSAQAGAMSTKRL